MKNKNISFQLSIYFLISETILSVIIVLFGYNYVRESLLESYRHRLQYDVQEVLDNVKNSMDDAVRLTDNLESDFNQIDLQKNAQKYIEMVFKGQADMQAFAMVASVSDRGSKPITDFRLFRSGAVIKSDTGRFYSNHAKTDQWIKQMLLTSKPEWSAPFYSPEMGSRLMIYARPFDYTKDGRSLHATIFCTVSENLFMSELKRMTLALILLILFIGSITIAVTIYFSIRLVSPITVLADDSRKIMEAAGVDPVHQSKNSGILSDSGLLLNMSQKYADSHLNDLKVLADNMEKMKERLALYRKDSIQSSLDKEEMDKELMLARDIEMSMVPTKFPLYPDRNDFDCFGQLIPAKIVGGDLFDIFLLNDNQLFISISDTLGKGIPAAMFSVITRTFIRSIANPITRLGKIMESLNNELCLGLESDMFATVLLGKLNLVTGEFIYCNAGHPHPFILRNNHSEEILAQSHGIPVGVKSNLQFSESSTILAPGESLITFSDGVTEEYNEHGEFFGMERLIAVVKPLHELSTQRIVNNVLDELEKFRGKAETHDDTTFVAIKFNPR